METIKKILGVVPTGVWIIIGLFVLVGLFWFSDDVGSWWEGRKQAQFDKADAEKQAVIDDLTKQRDVAIQRATEAEAREVGKIVEADLLRQEAAKSNPKIENAQKQIDKAVTDYSTDLEIIEKRKTGEITNLDLCTWSCEESAKQGYPCRPNYCDKFK